MKLRENQQEGVCQVRLSMHRGNLRPLLMAPTGFGKTAVAVEIIKLALEKGKKYIKLYGDIQKSKHLHFITTTGHIYRYFFADAIVLNGTSTVEVEACAIGKPLFIVRTCTKSITDPYDMVNSGAAAGIIDSCEIEDLLIQHFNNGDFHCPKKQRQRIKDMGITFDGLMHKRIQDRLAGI